MSKDELIIRLNWIMENAKIKEDRDDEYGCDGVKGDCLEDGIKLLIEELKKSE